MPDPTSLTTPLICILFGSYPIAPDRSADVIILNITLFLRHPCLHTGLK